MSEMITPPTLKEGDLIYITAPAKATDANSVLYTKNFLDKLENLFAASSYHLRYEKGNFKSGYCLLKDTKVVIINKYFPLEGKINALIDILAELDFDPKEFKEKVNQDFLSELRQTTLKF